MFYTSSYSFSDMLIRFSSSSIIILGNRMVVAMMMRTMMINMIAIIIISHFCIIAVWLLLLSLSSWPLHVIIRIMTTIIMSNNWDDE